MSTTTTEEEVKKKVTLRSSDGDDFVVDEAVSVESLSSFSALCSINPTTTTTEEEEEAKEKKFITLKSCDDVTFEVDEAVAVESQTIKHMIEDGCADDNGIPLPNVDSEILAMVIEYCEKHVEAAAAAVPKGGSGGDDDRTKENELRKWDADFVKVDQDTLFDLILAANYLDIKSLLDLTSQTMAVFIKDKSPEEVREIFGIENDFTPEEEEAVRRENQWAFD